MTEITKEAFGVGLISIFEAQVFPFMLSSTHTARTHVRESHDTEEVKTDIWYAVGISIAFSFLLAYLLKDWTTGIYGTIFALLLMYIYEMRGELI
jgi:hypothetical protein